MGDVCFIRQLEPADVIEELRDVGLKLEGDKIIMLSEESPAERTVHRISASAVWGHVECREIGCDLPLAEGGGTNLAPHSVQSAKNSYWPPALPGWFGDHPNEAGLVLGEITFAVHLVGK
jgi:hypothetical protein